MNTVPAGVNDVSVLADPVAEITRILGKRGATILLLTNELATCVGALRGVATSIRKDAPKSAAMLDEIAANAFATLTRAAVS